MFFYHIYGVDVKSEVQLYNIAETNVDEAEVYIHYDEPDAEILKDYESGMTSAVTKDYAWFVNEIGLFVGLNGNEIIIKPFCDTNDLEVGSFVLGWGFAYLFHQRNCLAIHCTALEYGDNAILVSGASGAGKSTTAMELINRGKRYLVDDIAMVNLDTVTIDPGFPVQKVCRDVAEKMEGEELIYINEKKDKFALNNLHDFCNEPKKVSHIFFIEKTDTEDVVVERKTGLAKWNAIANSLFLLEAYMCLGFPASEKQKCLELAGKVEFITIKRPEGKNTLKEICDIIDKIAIGQAD